MKTVFALVSLLFLFQSYLLAQTTISIPPTVASSRPATAKEKIIFKDLPVIFKEDQRLRGDLADLALELRSKAKDSTERA